MMGPDYKEKIWNGIGEKLGEGGKCKKRFNITDIKMSLRYFLHSSFNNLLVTLSFQKVCKLVPSMESHILSSPYLHVHSIQSN